jgi:hypothetical protein
VGMLAASRGMFFTTRKLLSPRFVRLIEAVR